MVDLCLALEVYLVLYGFCTFLEEHPEKNEVNENKATISMNGKNRFILPQLFKGKDPFYLGTYYLFF